MTNKKTAGQTAGFEIQRVMFLKGETLIQAGYRKPASFSKDDWHLEEFQVGIL